MMEERIIPSLLPRRKQCRIVRSVSTRYLWGEVSPKLLRLLTSLQGGCAWVICGDSGFAQRDLGVNNKL